MEIMEIAGYFPFVFRAGPIIRPFLSFIFFIFCIRSGNRKSFIIICICAVAESVWPIRVSYVIKNTCVKSYRIRKAHRYPSQIITAGRSSYCVLNPLLRQCEFFSQYSYIVYLLFPRVNDNISCDYLIITGQNIIIHRKG